LFIVVDGFTRTKHLPRICGVAQVIRFDNFKRSRQQECNQRVSVLRMRPWKTNERESASLDPAVKIVNKIDVRTTKRRRG
jgi:hypothetical protein